jgi:molecular chaperone IbpA
MSVGMTGLSMQAGAPAPSRAAPASQPLEAGATLPKSHGFGRRNGTGRRHGHLAWRAYHSLQWKEYPMRTLDWTPYRRSTVGFDRLFEFLENAGTAAENYPPFDIERTGEEQYRITIAVAGFKRDEIDITAHQNALTVAARKALANEGEAPRNMLYTGIATRAFERRFQLADFVRVTGADLADGLLTIALVREVPEAMKPHKISIGGAAPTLVELDRDAA